MPLIRLEAEWKLGADGDAALRDVIRILGAVERERSLSRACRALGLSYRHAWGLLRAAGRQLGGELIHATRGQGATLSALGERLVWANRRVAARLAPMLDSLALELESEIRQALSTSRPPIRLQASHAFALDALRDHFRERETPFELRYCGSEEALASVRHGNCQLAGFHVPVGELESIVLERWQKWLHPRSQVLIHVVTRRQGIVVAPGNPKRVHQLSDLARPGVRFVNRQRGSGTRLLLDLLLGAHRIDCRDITGFDNVEFTHAAVAAYIASGMGDAGVAIETAAGLFGLSFVPLLEERYFLVCDAAAVDSLPVVTVRQALGSAEFRARLARLPGICADTSGEIEHMSDVYPRLALRKRTAVA